MHTIQFCTHGVAGGENGQDKRRRVDCSSKVTIGTIVKGQSIVDAFWGIGVTSLFALVTLVRVG